MGLFGNLFSKQNCAICDKERGAMGRKKIRGDQYICSDCAKRASQYISVREFDLDQLNNHLHYMEQEDSLYREYLKKQKS